MNPVAPVKAIMMHNPSRPSVQGACGDARSSRRRAAPYHAGASAPGYRTDAAGQQLGLRVHANSLSKTKPPHSAKTKLGAAICVPKLSAGNPEHNDPILPL